MEITKDYTTFDPHTYLQEYYAEVVPENRELLRFLVAAFRDVPSHSLMLDFGSGPTLYSSIVASSRVQEIHFCDYSEANLEEVRNWLRADLTAFGWRAYTHAVLELESQLTASEHLENRELETRSRVKRVFRCDATSPTPIGHDASHYDVLVSNLCLEAAADSLQQWQQCMLNVTSLIKPGGKLILTAVKGATSYSVGNVIFPVVSIVEQDIRDVLLLAGFAENSIQFDWTHADHPVHPYQGLMFVTATRSRSWVATDQAEGELNTNSGWVIRD
jgi:nicotinamide N-methyltransferase